MANNKNYKWEWWKLQRGRGVRVALKEDVDKQKKQKYRPAIIIKTYPSHVKIQLLSTQASKDDYFSIKINNKVQYIRPIYFRTIDFDTIYDIWKDKKGKAIELNKDSTFFTKFIEMQYRELFDHQLDLIEYRKEKLLKKSSDRIDDYSL